MQARFSEAAAKAHRPVHVGSILVHAGLFNTPPAESRLSVTFLPHASGATLEETGRTSSVTLNRFSRATNFCLMLGCCRREEEGEKKDETA